jgi:hypothetical protein
MTVRDEILASFYGRLSASKEIDDATVAALRGLFGSAKKLKADDIVAVLAQARAKEAGRDPN